MLREALLEATLGKGGIVVVAGEPGLGKTRLVYECRKLFIACAGAASGRLPLWLEGRAASYASSRPYGLYQQLLSAWVGVAPEEGEEVARPALERAMRAAFGGKVRDDRAGLLAGDAWIVDGNHHETLDLRLRRADTTVFLDIPWSVCAGRAFRRGLQKPVGEWAKDAAILPGDGCGMSGAWPLSSAASAAQSPGANPNDRRTP